MPDVIIVGGGPAGSTMGCYLSQAGISNILFEKEAHPRPHVGESLVPSTTRVFHDIGFLETMEREAFPRKYGAAWHPPRRKANMFIKFAVFPQPGVDQDYTYHVDRAKFDHLLLKHAESKGTEVVQAVPVEKVVFDDGRAIGVRYSVYGRTQEISAKVVVDATGRSTLIGRQLNAKDPDPLFNQFAVHGWFENVDRGDVETGEDIHIYFLPVERGWVWQIPITDNITSIGVVAEKRVFKRSGKDYAGWFYDLAASAPDIEHAMRDAVHINDFKVEADYSYCMQSFCGDGYIMIGDAARFVDPIFSSGVSVALTSAKFASERIIQGLAENDTSQAMFAPYEVRLKRGTTIWYEFITLYYKLLPLFTKFIASRKHRHEVLQLLQGEVYDRRQVPVLDSMRRYIKAVEESKGHLLRDALDPNIPLDQIPGPLESVESKRVSTG
ncbi:MAG: NAD(P)/FAD-dependent oxidoreductase [Pseudomonadota bacterium]|nr:NAD(P)/FAD-dependent oxidoreductase [Pseudomonadota bacterium]